MRVVRAKLTLALGLLDSDRFVETRYPNYSRIKIRSMIAATPSELTVDDELVFPECAGRYSLVGAYAFFLDSDPEPFGVSSLPSLFGVDIGGSPYFHRGALRVRRDALAAALERRRERRLARRLVGG